MRNTAKGSLILLGFAACAALATPDAGAQQSLDQRTVIKNVNSGPVNNAADKTKAIYSKIVEIDDAPWIRLRFDEVSLTGSKADGNESYLKITSLLDGATQFLDMQSVRQWGYTSAYFNGDAVLVELVAHPDTGFNEISLSSVWAGTTSDPNLARLGPNGLCDGTDTRTLSADPRVARTLPTLCAASIIDDCQHCFLTAGQCNMNSNASLNVVQFNVPLSDGTCQLNGLIHPPPEDQYAADPDSHQRGGFSGLGHAWGYFGVFPNSNTGLTPHEAQGQWFTVDPETPVQGQAILTGFGEVYSPTDCTWDHAQKSSTGPLLSLNDDSVMHRADATPHDLGAIVYIAGTDLALGVQTYFACINSPASANRASWIGQQELQEALANPLGVCIPPDPPTFAIAGGPPDAIDPSGENFNVTISVDPPLVIEPMSAMLHYTIGGTHTAVPLTHLGNDSYTAFFPGGECYEPVSYSLSIDANGKTYSYPLTNEFQAVIANEFDTIISYDMEDDLGWTVSGIASAGTWVRAIPGDFGRNDPATDGDGSGKAYVTGANENEDLDGGPVYLTTTPYDLATLAVPELFVLAYHETNDPTNDKLTIDISDDDGANWIQLASTGDTNGWQELHFPLTGTVATNATIRVRFGSSDINSSITESAIDGFRIGDALCQSHCLPDVNGDGMVTPTDFTAWINAFNNNLPECDQNNDGMCTPTDFTAWIANFNAGC